MESSSLDPWKRANLEQFNVETLALIPQGQQQEYITVMKELAHARAIAALVLEQMFQKEQDRAAFFEPFINTKASEEADVFCDESITPDYTPDETGYPPNVADFAKSMIDHSNVIQIDFTHRERLI